MFKNKKSLINILCWFLPLQVGIIFLSKNLQATEQGMISGVALVVISFFLKTYLDNKENLEFYSQLIEEQRKGYKDMIDGLSREKYKSFSENIDLTVRRFQRELLEYLDKREAIARSEKSTMEKV